MEIMHKDGHRWEYDREGDRYICGNCLIATYDPTTRVDMCERGPWFELRKQGVLSVDDLIKKLEALPPNVRLMPVVMPSDKDWSYIKDVLYDEREGWNWPTLEESEVGWSPLDL